MFRDVPECSGMFHVPSFTDGQLGPGRRISFVILRTSLNRGSLNRGFTV